MTTLIGDLSRAPALNALASLDMQDYFLFAVPAVDREVICSRVRRYPQEPPVASADRAGNPSVHYDKFTTFALCSQVLSQPFSQICQLFNYISSSISNISSVFAAARVLRIILDVPRILIVSKGIIHLIAPIHAAVVRDINAARVRAEVFWLRQLRPQ